MAVTQPASVDSAAPEGFVIRFRFGEDTLAVTHDGRSERREVVGLAERVLELLRDQGPLTNAEVRGLTSASRTAVGDALRSLEAEGRAVRAELVGRAPRYEAA